MIPIELDQEIREGVFKTLPQIMDIQNEELRNKTRMHGRMRYRSTALNILRKCQLRYARGQCAGRPEYAHPRGWIQYAKSV